MYMIEVELTALQYNVELIYLILLLQTMNNLYSKLLFQSGTKHHNYR